MKPPVAATERIEIPSQSVIWDGHSTLRLVTFRHRRFDGSWSGSFTWELWQRGRAAAMLPYDPVQDQVVLIEQFRLPAHAAGFDPVMREIPAGLCEPGEDPLATIRRELREEAGIVAGRVQLVGDFVLSSGSSDETLSVYVGEVTAPSLEAANAEDLSPLRDENEDIRVLVVPADEAIADAKAGRLPNAVATLALLWLASERASLRSAWHAG